MAVGHQFLGTGCTWVVVDPSKLDESFCGFDLKKFSLQVRPGIPAGPCRQRTTALMLPPCSINESSALLFQLWNSSSDAPAMVRGAAGPLQLSRARVRRGQRGATGCAAVSRPAAHTRRGRTACLDYAPSPLYPSRWIFFLTSELLSMVLNSPQCLFLWLFFFPSKLLVFTMLNIHWFHNQIILWFPKPATQ